MILALILALWALAGRSSGKSTGTVHWLIPSEVIRVSCEYRRTQYASFWVIVSHFSTPFRISLTVIGAGKPPKCRGYMRLSDHIWSTTSPFRFELKQSFHGTVFTPSSVIQSYLMPVEAPVLMSKRIKTGPIAHTSKWWLEVPRPISRSHPIQRQHVCKQAASSFAAPGRMKT